MALTSVERLVKRLRREGVTISADYKWRRTYAGYWQRKQGAWSWEIYSQASGSIGSIYTVRECLEAARLEFDTDGTICVV